MYNDEAHTVLDIFRFASFFVPNSHEPKHIGRPMSGLFFFTEKIRGREFWKYIYVILEYFLIQEEHLPLVFCARKVRSVDANSS